MVEGAGVLIGDGAMNDEEILKRIKALVQEEEDLRGATRVTAEHRRAQAGRADRSSPSTSAGTCCDSAARGGSSARIPTRPRPATPTPWSATGNRRQRANVTGVAVPRAERGHRLDEAVDSASPTSMESAMSPRGAT